MFTSKDYDQLVGLVQKLGPIFKEAETNDGEINSEELNMERFLIKEYFTKPDDSRGVDVYFYSSTQIKNYLQQMVRTGYLGIKRIAIEMNLAGFVQENRKVAGVSKRGYPIQFKKSIQDDNATGV